MPSDTPTNQEAATPAASYASVVSPLQNPDDTDRLYNRPDQQDRHDHDRHDHDRRDRDRHDADPSGPPAPKKRKTNQRGVANLTPEQLARKRANDRESQRAIRERTKLQIESLERQVYELTNQEPRQAIQSIIRAKEAVEAENADLRRRLSAIMSILRPVADPDDSRPPNPLPPAPNPNSTAGPPVISASPLSPTSPAASLSSPAVSRSETAVTAASASRSETATTATTASIATNATTTTAITTATATATATAAPSAQPWKLSRPGHGPRSSLDLSSERLSLDFVIGPSHTVPVIQSGANGAQDLPGFRHLPLKHDISQHHNCHPASGPNSGLSDILPSLSPPSLYGTPDHYRQQDGDKHQTRDSRDSRDNHDHRHHRHHPDEHPRPPVVNCPPTCAFDLILLEFLRERRQRANDGFPVDQVIGPRQPSVAYLLNQPQSSNAHPISKVFSDVIARFPDLASIPERVAVLHTMFVFVRWQISPTRENFDQLGFMAPTPAQTTVPHPAWMDHVPFPLMRERMIMAGARRARELGIAADAPPDAYLPAFATDYVLEEFFIPYTRTLCLNWPYDETDALLRSPDTDELLVNPVFERHLRRVDNWSVGEAFVRRYPGLVGTYRLTGN